MIRLALPAGQLNSVLCLGAHCDDIEIGCGGTILRLLDENPGVTVTWVVFATNSVREQEARDSAASFLAGAGSSEIVLRDFRNSYFPYVGAEIKAFFETLKPVAPDLIFTHYREDRHQDHRTVSDITWSTFRDHFILEYEIPKYDGDLHTPNFYVPMPRDVAARKVDTIYDAFASQHRRQWFSKETFQAVLRLRGIECNAESGYAEGFYARKTVI